MSNDSEVVELRRALRSAISTAWFLHECLTNPHKEGVPGGCSYVYPEMTIATLEELSALAPEEQLVCVLCGEPWIPPVKNRCECGGFCSWGYEKGGPPSSWNVHENGAWSPKPPPGK